SRPGAARGIWLCGLAVVLGAVSLGALPADEKRSRPQAAEGVAVTNTPGLLRFASGDSLQGELIEIAPTNIVRWRHGTGNQTLDVDYAAVSRIRLANTNTVPGRSPARCLVRFDNNDELVGD